MSHDKNNMSDCCLTPQIFQLHYGEQFKFDDMIMATL